VGVAVTMFGILYVGTGSGMQVWAGKMEDAGSREILRPSIQHPQSIVCTYEYYIGVHLMAARSGRQKTAICGLAGLYSTTACG
jgi:hypothetical protein